jgi:molybdopterin-guanine dinucleotide biosynthesis protein A
MSPANVAAAILAGGGGTRMGEGVVKALLSVGGQRIIDRQLAALRPLFAEVVIAANDPEPWAGLGVRVVPDRMFSGPLPRLRGRERASLASGEAHGTPTVGRRLSQGLPSPSPSPADGRGDRIGPMAGLDAILAALPPTTDAVVCVASDMPFLSPALLEHLRDAAPNAAALVPRIAGRAEPLLARYARGAAPVVADQIANGRYAMADLLARLDGGVVWIEEPALRALDPDLRSIVNVNTPADLARLAAHDPTPRF